MLGSLIWTCVIPLAAGVSMAAAASPGGGQAITLDEAIRLGLARNPSLAALRSELDITKAAAAEARAQRWPRVTAEAALRGTDNQVMVFGDKLTAGEFAAGDFALDQLNDPDPIRHGVAAVGVEVPLYTSGRIRSGIAAADFESGAALARLRGGESDLIMMITETYYGIDLARAAAQVSEAAVSDARSHEAVATARHESGAALQSDLLRAQVLRMSRERDLDRKKADVELARARLRRLLASGPQETLEPVSGLTPPEGGLGDLDQWLAYAAASRPEIEDARQRSTAAHAGAQLARGSLGPELAALARYERNTNSLDFGEGSYLVGVSLRWAAFDHGRAARISAAEARQEAAGASARAVEDTVLLEVEQAYRDAVVAAGSLEVARETVKAAEEARRITAERYQAGLLPIVDLLDVETELTRARMAEISARYDAVVGRARLERAGGGTPGATEAPR